MLTKNLFLLLLLIVNSNNDEKKSIINKLIEKITSYQLMKTTHLIPPFKWYHKQGLFRSEIKCNFYGNPFYQYLRNNLINVADNNMFATGWILTVLIEANLYGKNIELLDTKRFESALNAINDFKNRNQQNQKNTLLRTFWQQKLNETSKIWYQNPENLHNVAVNLQTIFNLIPYKQMKNILKFFNLDELFEIVYTNSGQEIEFMFDMFVIPSDFDDTYLNLGLGAVLSKLNSNNYRNFYLNWCTNNSDTKRLVESTIKYTYEPFSNDFSRKLIDPRTYFFIRNFLNEVKMENKSLSLLTTWIQNVDEQKQMRKYSVSMPYNRYNNKVAANFVYGATAASIYNINGYGDYLLNTTKLQSVYLNTTRLISWTIKSNFSSRPDLALLYYPSRYNFYWYVSRSLFLIETESRCHKTYERLNSDLKSIINEIKIYLKKPLEINVSDFLLKSYRSDSDGTFFCDFLGLNDTDLFGNLRPNLDDCLFSTSQAINSLIAIWTYKDYKTKHIIFKKSTPNKIKSLINTTVNWLQTNIFNEKYKKLNAFFSGCVKGKYEYPFFYPSNYYKFFNETNIDFNKEFELPYFDHVILGVEGLINEDKYLLMLKKNYFGAKTRIDFNGLNSDMAFIYWTSEPYTYAVALLALSQYNNLKE